MTTTMMIKRRTTDTAKLNAHVQHFASVGFFSFPNGAKLPGLEIDRPPTNREKFAKSTKLPAAPVASPGPAATTPTPEQLATPPAPTAEPVEAKTSKAEPVADQRSNREKFAAAIKLPGRQSTTNQPNRVPEPVGDTADQRSNRERFTAAIKLPK